MQKSYVWMKPAMFSGRLESMATQMRIMSSMTNKCMVIQSARRLLIFLPSMFMIPPYD